MNHISQHNQFQTIMHVVISGTIIEVSEQLVKKSPYLTTLYNTQLYVDTVGDYPTLDVSVREFNTYLQFLSKGIFGNLMVLEKMLDYMGHEDFPKNRGYKDQYYKELLHDYLYKELVCVGRINPISCKAELNDLFGSINYFVSGSTAVMKMTGDSYRGDLDIYLLESDADELVSHAIQYCKDQRIRYTIHKHVINVFMDIKHYTKVQIVLKKYNTLFDIVKDHDVDCCACLINKDSIYATRRAKYALENKLNHFNIDYYTGNYCDRLLKYHHRGFEVFMPQLDYRSINIPIINHNVKVLAQQRGYLGIPWLNHNSDPHLLARYIKYEADVCDELDPLSKVMIAFAYGITTSRTMSYNDAYYSSEEEVLGEPQWHNDIYDSKISFSDVQDCYATAEIFNM